MNTVSHIILTTLHSRLSTQSYLFCLTKIVEQTKTPPGGGVLLIRSVDCLPNVHQLGLQCRVVDPRAVECAAAT